MKLHADSPAGIPYYVKIRCAVASEEDFIGLCRLFPGFCHRYIHEDIGAKFQPAKSARLYVIPMYCSTFVTLAVFQKIKRNGGPASTTRKCCEFCFRGIVNSCYKFGICLRVANSGAGVEKRNLRIRLAGRQLRGLYFVSGCREFRQVEIEHILREDSFCRNTYCIVVFRNLHIGIDSRHRNTFYSGNGLAVEYDLRQIRY